MEGEEFKKIIKLFEDKKGIKQGKKQQDRLWEVMTENATPIEQVKENILFLMEHPLGKHTTKYVSRAGLPFASLKNAIKEDTEELRKHRHNTGVLRTSPLLFGQFKKEIEAIEDLAPNEFKSFVESLNQEVDEALRAQFVRTLEDEEFFSGDCSTKFEKWLATHHPKENKRIQELKTNHSYNRLLEILQESMQDLPERYDSELGKQVADYYLDTYLQSDTITKEFDTRWWYETWIKEHRPEIYSFWKEEEKKSPHLSQRTQSLESYLSHNQETRQGEDYA